MEIAVRSIALTLMLSLVLGGPVAPLASAQQPTQATTPAQDSDKGAYDVGAGLANIVFVPGKAVLCVMGGTVSAALLIITFGNAYREAAGLAREGCGGKWVLVGDDLRPAPTPRQAFDWEKN